MRQFGEFFLNHWDLFLALGIILALIISKSIGSKISGIKEIEPQDAVRTINRDNGAVLDVREESEFKAGHILEAVHIPLGALKSRLGELEKYKERPLIVVCRSGNRSSSACSQLSKEGFTQVFNLRGGMMAWESANLPVTKGKKK